MKFLPQLVNDLILVKSEVTVGVALDGFRIKIGGGDLTLDECGGAVGSDGEYAYYFTDHYPYSLRCFKGTPMIPVSATDETPDVTDAQCPSIYHAIRDINNLLHVMNAGSETQKVDVETAKKTQRKRTSSKDDELVTKILDWVKSMGELKTKTPSVKDVLESLTDGRKRRSFTKLFKADGKVEARMDTPDMGYLPYGVWSLDSLDKCGYNNGDCLQKCSNSAYHDCNPETDSCLNFYGFYQKAVVCPDMLPKPVPLESNRFHYKKSDLMMAMRKNGKTAFKSSPLSMSRMMMNEEVTCFCRDFNGAKIGGTEVTFSNDTDFSHFTNIQMAQQLGCLKCPANLIEVGSAVSAYETCEDPGNTIYVHGQLLNETKFSQDENYPLESRCTCPPGLIWSFAQMWCVPREHCLPAEIGVPAGCDAKSMMLTAIGLPPLDCDITDPSEPYPSKYYAELTTGEYIYTEELDSFGNVMNNATFKTWTMEDTMSKPTYPMEDDEWCSEWYNYNSVGSWQENDKVSHYEYERFDEYFFEMIECDPVKMIMSHDNTTTVYGGKSKKVFGGVELSLTFTPRGEHQSPLVNFACYTTTYENSGTFTCKDIKVKFICKDWEHYDYNNYDDHHDYDHHAGYSDYDMGPTVGYNYYDDYQTHADYAIDIAGMDYGSGHFSSPRPVAYGETHDMSHYSQSAELSHWEKEQAASEVRDEQYFMILENYGCALLFFEYYQAKMYKADNLVDGCVESINDVFDVCLRRWQHEEWAQTIDYNAVVDNLVSYTKQGFCFSQLSPQIEFPETNDMSQMEKGYGSNTYELYKQSMGNEIREPLFNAFTSCFGPMTEIFVDESRYSREVCQVSHNVHQCVGQTVHNFIDDFFSNHNVWHHSMGRDILDVLLEFSPGCEGHFPTRKICGCTAKEHLDNVIECQKMYTFPYMPLHDKTPEAFLRTGVCAYLQFEMCEDPHHAPHGKDDLKQRVEDVVGWITRDIPPFAFTIVNLLRERFPRSVEEAIEFGQWVAGQFIEGINEKVKKAEKLIGFTVSSFYLISN